MKKIIGTVTLLAFLWTPTAWAAAWQQPNGLWLDETGRLLVTDLIGNRIFVVNDGETSLFSGDHIGGYHDLVNDKALYHEPYYLVPFWQGYAVSDRANHAIRYIVDGKVKTLAGGNSPDLINKPTTAAAFHHTQGLAVQGKLLYIADTDNHILRQLDAAGNVTTLAGSQKGFQDGLFKTARFNQPTGLAIEDGKLYLTDSGNHALRFLENGMVKTIAGNGEAGYVDGVLAIARFNQPKGLILKDGVIYIADYGNGAIRQIKNNRVTTIADLGPQAKPVDLALWENTLLITDEESHSLLTIELLPQPSIITTEGVDTPYYYSIQRALSEGWLDSDTFVANATISHEEWLAALANLYCYRYPHTVIDNVVAWANQMGLIRYRYNFKADAALSRAELAYSSQQFAEKFGYDTKWKQDPLNLTITNEEQWAKDALRWAYGNGLIVNDVPNKGLCAHWLTHLEENR